MSIDLKPIGVGILGLTVFLSAVSVVYKKHESRQLFMELQTLQRHVETLQEHWSQLLLEQGTWAADARVERLARTQLGMVLPDPASVVVVSGARVQS